MLAESRFGWALFAGTQNNHNPIMGSKYNREDQNRPERVHEMHDDVAYE